MSEELSIALANVETHINEFSRGYHLGRIQAEIRNPGIYDHRLPDCYLPDVSRILDGIQRKTSVKVVRYETPNRYDICFVQIQIAVFPAVWVTAATTSSS